MRKKSFPFNRYPNVFERLGYSPAAIEAMNSGCTVL